MGILTANESERLSANFSTAEFRCKCGCGTCNVSGELIKKLEHLRMLMKKSLVINSGCRCEDYNTKVGGSPDSNHITSDRKQCIAADIHAPTALDKYLLARSAFTLGFSGIGVAASYVHLDIRKPHPSLWKY